MVARRIRPRTIVSAAVLAAACTVIAAMLYAISIPAPYHPSGRATIFLYGERHGQEAILQKELAAWQEHYEAGMRDLFIEMPYYTAQFLNLWMETGDDAILEGVYDDMAGTLGHVPAWLDFMRTLRSTCPETVLHGTDVGHQSMTTGRRYLEYLEGFGASDTEEYKLAQECIRQGEEYYELDGGDPVAATAYREEALTGNFIRAYDALGGIPVMGIYGNLHADPLRPDGATDSMAMRLVEHYGDVVQYQPFI